MPVITLTTDFGLKDGNVGVMKGVIWSIAPLAQIADLSHLIGPQNIPEAALILARSVPYFPPGTIHVAVVDPGVGTARRPIAGRLGNQYVVGPDNGVFTLLIEKAENAKLPLHFVHLTNPRYWLSDVSHVFHGRDIFAPVAGHLAAGLSLEKLGEPVDDLVRLHLPQPEPIPDGLRGEIIHVDHFGNLASNITQEHLANAKVIGVSLNGQRVTDFVQTFGERATESLISLFGSTGNLLVCVVNGSAAERLGTRVGDKIEVQLEQG